MKSEKKNDYIITFDIWGTLLNNVSYKHKRIWILKEYLEEKGYQIDLLSIEKSYKQLNSYLQIHRDYRFVTLNERLTFILNKGLNINLSQQQQNEVIELFQYPILKTPPTLVKNALRIIQSLSNYAYLGLISDTGFSTSLTLETILQRYGLPIHNFIYTNYSECLGFNKPHKIMFKNIIENEFNIPTSHIYHIGDCKETDIEGALLSNINSIHISDESEKQIINHEIHNIKNRKHYIAKTLEYAWNILLRELGVNDYEIT